MTACEDPIMPVESSNRDARFTGRFKDDITGQILRDDLVLEARLKEIRYFEEKGVWAKVPIAEAKRRTGKSPISVRCLSKVSRPARGAPA